MRVWKTFCAGLLLSLTACSEDDYHYPDVVTDMVEMETDSKGYIHLIRTDEGAEYSPNKSITFEKATPDSLYRVRCIYQPAEDSSCTLYNITLLVSPFPVGPSSFKEILTNPVKVTSVWQSGNYVNLHLGIMTQGGTHKYQFINQGIQRNSIGKNTLHLLLYHDQNEDPEAYTREVFLSCPLTRLNLQSGDSIHITLNTYEGEKVYSFLK